MADLTPFELVYVVFILIASFAVRGGAGFGGLNGPLLMVVMPAKIIVPALVFLGIISSGAIVVRDYRHINWQPVWRTLPWGIFGTLIGLWLFTTLKSGAIEKGLGLFLLLYGLYALWRIGRPLGRSRIPPNVLAGIMGTTSGTAATVFGAMAGVFVAVYFNILELNKREFRATIAATLIIMGVARAIGYVAVGAITQEVMVLTAIALPLIGIGVLLGNVLHARLNQQGFNRLIGVLFIVIGAFLFLR
jgi:uncharacterized membrane protein YfcA